METLKNKEYENNTDFTSLQREEKDLQEVVKQNGNPEKTQNSEQNEIPKKVFERYKTVGKALQASADFVQEKIENTGPSDSERRVKRGKLKIDPIFDFYSNDMDLMQLDDGTYDFVYTLSSYSYSQPLHINYNLANNTYTIKSNILGDTLVQQKEFKNAGTAYLLRSEIKQKAAKYIKLANAKNYCLFKAEEIYTKNTSRCEFTANDTINEDIYLRFLYKGYHRIIGRRYLGITSKQSEELASELNIPRKEFISEKRQVKDLQKSVERKSKKRDGYSGKIQYPEQKNMPKSISGKYREVWLTLQNSANKISVQDGDIIVKRLSNDISNLNIIPQKNKTYNFIYSVSSHGQNCPLYINYDTTKNIYVIKSNILGDFKLQGKNPGYLGEIETQALKYIKLAHFENFCLSKAKKKVKKGYLSTNNRKVFSITKKGNLVLKHKSSILNRNGLENLTPIELFENLGITSMGKKEMLKNKLNILRETYFVHDRMDEIYQEIKQERVKPRKPKK